MKPLSLNFSHYDERRRQRSKFVVLVLLLLVLAFVVSETFNQQRRLNELSLQQSATTVIKPKRNLSEQDLRQNRLTRTLVSELNTPWFAMLAAIEQVKQANPDVFLTELEPNVKKGEVIISGEVKTLAQLLAFIDALNQQTVFYQALLQNQRQLDTGSGMLAFSLKVRWYSHE